MRDILFYDPCCPKAYTFDTLRNSPLGGTEATVIRIAEALDAYVMQHNREKSEGRYLAPNSIPSGIKQVIVLRRTDALWKAKALFPRAQIRFWMHDVAGTDLYKNAHILSALGVDIIAVSDWHKTQIGDWVQQAKPTKPIPITRIYNPVDDALVADSSEIRPEKLIFLSSPHKGLDQTLEYFTYVRRSLPDSLLYILNPGYLIKDLVSLPGVVHIGPRPHHEVMAELKDSLCTFYINRVFPETFGLIYAESNALGVPVLAHRMGAAPEVLSPPESQLVDCSNPKAVVEKVIAWRKERPKVVCKPEFRLTQVKDAWSLFLA